MEMFALLIFCLTLTSLGIGFSKKAKAGDRFCRATWKESGSGFPKTRSQIQLEYTVTAKDGFEGRSHILHPPQESWWRRDPLQLDLAFHL